MSNQVWVLRLFQGLKWGALACFLLAGLTAPAQAGIISYGGNFSGVFPAGSDFYSLSADWTIDFDDSLVGSAPTTSGFETLEGVVTSMLIVAHTPSPNGPVPIPYPGLPAPDCSKYPHMCEKTVKVTFQFGELVGLTIYDSNFIELAGSDTGIGIHALYQADRSLSTLLYASASDDDVTVSVYASNFSGSFRRVPEPSLAGFLVMGLIAGGLLRRYRMAAFG